MKSTAGFILALIGGIFSILGSVGFVLIGINEGSELEANISTMITEIAFGVWILIMGIIAIIASVKMNKEDNALVKTGGIMALIVGILSLNIFTIVGGIVGMVQSKNIQ